ERPNPQAPMVRQLQVSGELDRIDRRIHRDRLSIASTDGVFTNAITNSRHSTESGVTVVRAAASIRAWAYSTAVPMMYPSFSMIAGIIIRRNRAGFEAITKNATCHAIATDRNP